jgi:type IV secretion system protein TrbG
MKNIAQMFIFIYSSFIAASPAEIISKAHQAASDQPEKDKFLNAAMVFDWEPNRVYQIYTKPGRITDMALESQETLISVAGGDSQRWTITDSSSGKDAELRKHIFIKPHQFGISNNLIITTDRRVYHIELHSLEHVPYQAVVTWNYPKSPMLLAPSRETTSNNQKTPLQGLGLRQLNFNFHFIAKEKPAWMPRRVFDDGHKTYIEFPESMQDIEAPILWGLSKAKEQETLNYRRYKNFYIIDHLIDLAELNLGINPKVVIGIERDIT